MWSFINDRVSQQPLTNALLEQCGVDNLAFSRVDAGPHALLDPSSLNISSIMMKPS